MNILIKRRLCIAVLIALAPLSSVLAQQADQPKAAAAPARPGYLIVIGTGVDPLRLRDYGMAAGRIVMQRGGRLLFATREGANEFLEGGPFTSSIRVFEFPSVEAVREFYHSPEYQKVIPLRVGNGRFDIIVSDSFVLPSTP